jgi:hypothetical protein
MQVRDRTADRRPHEVRIVLLHDPGAQSATAPRPSAAFSAPAQGAQAKRPEAAPGA